MPNAVIVAYARSPFTPAGKGELAKMRPDDLLAVVLKGLFARQPLNMADIEDVLVGCAFPEGEQGLNIARNVSFLSGIPLAAGGATINRYCGSSMETIHMAAGKIACGAGELFVCAGVESMSRIPMGGFNPSPNPDLYEMMASAYMPMGLTAEQVAAKHQIDRKTQEEFALASHQKAAAAELSPEIIPVPIRGGVAEKDGCIRLDPSLEKMAQLTPAFDANGTVTAATSSPMTDGAVAVIVASEDYAKKHNLPILARIKSFAVSGIAPEIMGLGPVEATHKALARAGLTLADMDIIELNEAFAAQALGVIKELNIDTGKLNLDGGAIALGHPLGASGGRITGKAAQLLAKHKKKYALAAMCIGGGQGIATILERA
ncbi:MAG: thiolase family protein [Alphaproteobacteria bacterium]|nr:thiolase family protein [Alphaproteobacteria bacterium]